VFQLLENRNILFKDAHFRLQVSEILESNSPIVNILLHSMINREPITLVDDRTGMEKSYIYITTIKSYIDTIKLYILKDVNLYDVTLANYLIRYPITDRETLKQYLYLFKHGFVGEIVRRYLGPKVFPIKQKKFDEMVNKLVENASKYKSITEIGYPNVKLVRILLDKYPPEGHEFNDFLNHVINFIEKSNLYYNGKQFTGRELCTRLITEYGFEQSLTEIRHVGSRYDY
jgi:hypothetical protein